MWVGGLAAAFVGAFVVASLLFGVQALRAEARGRRLALTALSTLALAFGLLSKENAVVVPGLSLAIFLGLAAESRTWRARLAPAAALVGVQAALVAGYLLLLRPAVLGTALTGAEPIGGRLAQQWLSSLASWPELFAWLLLPIRSSTSDAVRVVTQALDPGAALGVLLLLGSGVLFLHWLRRGHGVAAIALAWIWIAFLPTSGLAPLLHARAERNLFLSTFGLALLLPCAGSWLRSLRAPPALVTALAIALLCVLSERTLRRQPDWRSTTTLFERDLAGDPRHREGRLNLIVAHVKAGDLPAAKRHVDVLVSQRSPEGWTSYALDASLLETACLVNRAVGRDADTLSVIEAEPAHGGVAQMPAFYDCYAGALERLGKHDRALPIYETLHRRAPAGESAGFALGAARCHGALGAREEALAWLARIDPAAVLRPSVARQSAEIRASLRKP